MDDRWAAGSGRGCKWMHECVRQGMGKKIGGWVVGQSPWIGR